MAIGAALLGLASKVGGRLIQNKKETGRIFRGKFKNIGSAVNTIKENVSASSSSSIVAEQQNQNQMETLNRKIMIGNMQMPLWGLILAGLSLAIGVYKVGKSKRWF